MTATQLDAAGIEAAARAMCLEGGFDPNEIMANDGPRWRYYVPGARAAIIDYLTTTKALNATKSSEAEAVGYVDRNLLPAIKEQGRSEPLTIWLESYVPEHAPLFTHPSPVEEATPSPGWNEAVAVERFVENLPLIVEDHVCGGSDTRPVVDVAGLIAALAENALAIRALSHTKEKS